MCIVPLRVIIYRPRLYNGIMLNTGYSKAVGLRYSKAVACELFSLIELLTKSQHIVRPFCRSSDCGIYIGY